MQQIAELQHRSRRLPRLTLRSAAAVVAVVTAASGLQVGTPAAAETPLVSLLGTSAPTVASDPDTASVELGMRFSTSVAGSVRGVRFFKGAANTGTHVGSLWTTSGTKLGAATFTNESASGWQSVTFSQPVALKPGRTYVASYVAPRGRYAVDDYGFSRSRTVGPLTAPAGAGVYKYGAGGFPSSTYRASNYFVDVLFAPDTAPATTTPVVVPLPSPTSSAAPAPAPPPPAPVTPSPPATTPAASTPPAPTTGPVSYGWQITGVNTGLSGAGVDKASLPVFTGPVTAGMTLSQVKITSTLDLTALPNVTLDRVWVAPASGRNGVILGAGTVIKDSDIDGGGLVQGERIGIYGNTTGAYTISRVSIYNVSIGAWLDGSGSGTLEDGYIRTLSINGAHQDGFTRRAGLGALQINRMRIDSSGPSVTGAFFIANTWGDRIGGVMLKDSYLEGEGYNMALYNNGTGTSVGMDNIRVRSVGWGPLTTGGFIDYTSYNNVRRFDGSRLPAADGALIPK